MEGWTLTLENFDDKALKLAQKQDIYRALVVSIDKGISERKKEKLRLRTHIHDLLSVRLDELEAALPDMPSSASRTVISYKSSKEEPILNSSLILPDSQASDPQLVMAAFYLRILFSQRPLASSVAAFQDFFAQLKASLPVLSSIHSKIVDSKLFTPGALADLNDQLHMMSHNIKGPLLQLVAHLVDSTASQLSSVFFNYISSLFSLEGLSDDMRKVDALVFQYLVALFSLKQKFILSVVKFTRPVPQELLYIRIFYGYARELDRQYDNCCQLFLRRFKIAYTDLETDLRAQLERLSPRELPWNDFSVDNQTLQEFLFDFSDDSYGQRAEAAFFRFLNTGHFFWTTLPGTPHDSFPFLSKLAAQPSFTEDPEASIIYPIFSEFGVGCMLTAAQKLELQEFIIVPDSGLVPVSERNNLEALVVRSLAYSTLVVSPANVDPLAAQTVEDFLIAFLSKDVEKDNDAADLNLKAAILLVKDFFRAECYDAASSQNLLDRLNELEGLDSYHPLFSKLLDMSRLRDQYEDVCALISKYQERNYDSFQISSHRLLHFSKKEIVTQWLLGDSMDFLSIYTSRLKIWNWINYQLYDVFKQSCYIDLQRLKAFLRAVVVEDYAFFDNVGSLYSDNNQGLLLMTESPKDSVALVSIHFREHHYIYLDCSFVLRNYFTTNRRDFVNYFDLFQPDFDLRNGMDNVSKYLLARINGFKDVVALVLERLKAQEKKLPSLSKTVGKALFIFNNDWTAVDFDDSYQLNVIAVTSLLYDSFDAYVKSPSLDRLVQSIEKFSLAAFKLNVLTPNFAALSQELDNVAFEDRNLRELFLLVSHFHAWAQSLKVVSLNPAWLAAHSPPISQYFMPVQADFDIEGKDEFVGFVATYFKVLFEARLAIARFRLLTPSYDDPVKSFADDCLSFCDAQIFHPSLVPWKYAKVFKFFEVFHFSEFLVNNRNLSRESIDNYMTLVSSRRTVISKRRVMAYSVAIMQDLRPLLIVDRKSWISIAPYIDELDAVIGYFTACLSGCLAHLFQSDIRDVSLDKIVAYYIDPQDEALTLDDAISTLTSFFPAESPILYPFTALQNFISTLDQESGLLVKFKGFLSGDSVQVESLRRASIYCRIVEELNHAFSSYGKELAPYSEYSKRFVKTLNDDPKAFVDWKTLTFDGLRISDVVPDCPHLAIIKVPIMDTHFVAITLDAIYVIDNHWNDIPRFLEEIQKMIPTTDIATLKNAIFAGSVDTVRSLILSVKSQFVASPLGSLFWHYFAFFNDLITVTEIDYDNPMELSYLRISRMMLLSLEQFCRNTEFLSAIDVAHVSSASDAFDKSIQQFYNVDKIESFLALAPSNDGAERYIHDVLSFYHFMWIHLRMALDWQNKDGDTDDLLVVEPLAMEKLSWDLTEYSHLVSVDFPLSYQEELGDVLTIHQVFNTFLKFKLSFISSSQYSADPTFRRLSDELDSCITCSFAAAAAAAAAAAYPRSYRNVFCLLSVKEFVDTVVERQDVDSDTWKMNQLARTRDLQPSRTRAYAHFYFYSVLMHEALNASSWTWIAERGLADAFKCCISYFLARFSERYNDLVLEISNETAESLLTFFVEPSLGLQLTEKLDALVQVTSAVSGPLGQVCTSLRNFVTSIQKDHSWLRDNISASQNNLNAMFKYCSSFAAFEKSVKALPKHDNRIQPWREIEAYFKAFKDHGILHYSQQQTTTAIQWTKELKCGLLFGGDPQKNLLIVVNKKHGSSVSLDEDFLLSKGHQKNYLGDFFAEMENVFTHSLMDKLRTELKRAFDQRIDAFLKNWALVPQIAKKKEIDINHIMSDFACKYLVFFFDNILHPDLYKSSLFDEDFLCIAKMVSLFERGGLFSNFVSGLSKVTDFNGFVDNVDDFYAALDKKVILEEFGLNPAAIYADPARADLRNVYAKMEYFVDWLELVRHLGHAIRANAKVAASQVLSFYGHDYSYFYEALDVDFGKGRVKFFDDLVRSMTLLRTSLNDFQCSSLFSLCIRHNDIKTFMDNLDFLQVFKSKLLCPESFEPLSFEDCFNVLLMHDFLGLVKAQDGQEDGPALDALSAWCNSRPTLAPPPATTKKRVTAYLKSLVLEVMSRLDDPHPWHEDPVLQAMTKDWKFIRETLAAFFVQLVDDEYDSWFSFVADAIIGRRIQPKPYASLASATALQELAKDCHPKDISPFKISNAKSFLNAIAVSMTCLTYSKTKMFWSNNSSASIKEHVKALSRYCKTVDKYMSSGPNVNQQLKKLAQVFIKHYSGSNPSPISSTTF